MGEYTGTPWQFCRCEISSLSMMHFTLEIFASVLQRVIVCFTVPRP